MNFLVLIFRPSVGNAYQSSERDDFAEVTVCSNILELPRTFRDWVQKYTYVAGIMYTIYMNAKINEGDLLICLAAICFIHWCES